ncbi:HepT-like ribonuclease domain-containing protein [Neomoorella humiferrea]|uniref:HepT-like ribonuclease domain-containing protein n=1 Tax=Neomoorella humiferrea TaxID=676965 RepID=UPI003D8EF64C
MFNEELIAARLGIIHSAIRRLQLLARMPREQFLHDEYAVDIAENRLRRALEALFYLVRHLVVKSGLGVPQSAMAATTR